MHLPALLVFLLFGWFSPLGAYADTDVKQAQAVVLAWLETVDRADMTEAWTLFSVLLRDGMMPHDLSRVVAAGRTGFGTVIVRDRVSARRETALPGVPDGKYIVFTFHTRFENKQRATETVTPRWEDGRWKVSGYYVK
jgi:hypothetical protein